MAHDPTIRIATWNINGIRARFETVISWLETFSPDVALLQETKIEDDKFPREAIEDVGYNVAMHGQKTFNGVAILAKVPLEDVTARLPGDDGDEQARWLEALVCGDGRPVRVACLYAPNGNPVPGDKYDYKLAWLARLRERAEELQRSEEAVVMGGDYNIIPQTIDAHKPERWREDALFLPDTRHAWRRIVNAGWTDAFRNFHADGEHYSFWDFQGGAWRRNDGIRIDHLLLSPAAADRLVGAGIEREMRGESKPSDHVPVWCELSP